MVSGVFARLLVCPCGPDRWSGRVGPRVLAAVLIALVAAGCGTTRWSDTSRTATEQLLMSDAIDRAVSQIDFSPLGGRTIFLDNRYLAGEVDDRYLYSTLRQHMLASGVTIKDKLEDAQYVVEIRAGALGTNRADVLVGVPATTLPTGGAITGMPSSIPEISLIKRTAQQGVCKVAVFAYHREQGYPVWQSGAHQVVSKAKDVWIFGAGPIQRGSIYNGTRFAGDKVQIPLAKAEPVLEPALVSQIAHFAEPPPGKDVPAPLPPTDPVQQASHVEGSGTAPQGPAGSPPAGSSPAGAASPGKGAAAQSPPGPSNSFSGSAGAQIAPLGSQQWNNGTAGSGQSATNSANPMAGALGAVNAYKGAKTGHSGSLDAAALGAASATSGSTSPASTSSSSSTSTTTNSTTTTSGQ